MHLSGGPVRPAAAGTVTCQPRPVTQAAAVDSPTPVTNPHERDTTDSLQEAGNFDQQSSVILGGMWGIGTLAITVLCAGSAQDVV